MGIFDAFASLGSSILNASNVVSTNQNQLYLQHSANAYNERMIQQEREYNSPSAQMQRFADAGLNPNLIYSQLNNSYSPSNRSVAPPALQAPTADINSGGGLLQEYSAIKQAELIDSQIDESRTRAAVNEERGKYYASASALNTIRESLDNLKYVAFRNGNYYDNFVEGQIKSNLLTASKTLGQDLENEYLSKTMDNRILSTALNNTIMGLQGSYIESLTKKAYSDIVRNGVLNSLSNAQIARINVQNDLDNWRSVLAGQQYDWNEVLNSAKVENMEAQSKLYGWRANYTKRKYKFIPLNFGAGVLQNRANNFINALKLIPHK